MKYVLVIPDGAADRPLGELNRQTPLEAAETPHLDSLAQNGRLGTMAFDAGTISAPRASALLALLGYDVGEYPVAAAALVALGLGVDVQHPEQCYCCNLITATDDRRPPVLTALGRLLGRSGPREAVLADATGASVSDQEAQAVVDLLNERLGPLNVCFHLGCGRQHLMSASEALSARTTCPETMIGRRLRQGWPTGPDADRVGNIMTLADEALKDHDINTVRSELGESPITGIWLWGQGPHEPVPAFGERHDLAGALVADDPLAVGLGRHAGLHVVDVSARGHHTADALAALADQAAEAVQDFDFVCVVTAWPHVASLAGDVPGKLAAIEAVDQHVLAALVRALRSEDEEWRMLITPVQTTSCLSRQRVNVAAPFVMVGEGVKSVLRQTFSEPAATASDVHVKRSCEMMEYFLTVR